MKYNAYIHYQPFTFPTFIYTFDNKEDAEYWKAYKESYCTIGNIYEIREELA